MAIINYLHLTMANWVFAVVLAVFSLQVCVDGQMQMCLTETVSVGFPGNSADSATAVIGANFRLMCDRGTNSAVTAYTWYQNGEELSGEKSAELQFNEFQSSSGGVYECSGITPTCFTPRSSPVFTINSVPDVSVTVTPAIATVGESFTLNCQAPGWPTPTVQWERRDGSTTTVVGTSHVYTVASATASDAGTYYCVASNSISQNTFEAAVTVEITDVMNPEITTEVMITTSPPYNGTGERDLYIGVAITAGVGVFFGVVSFLICIIMLYMTGCRNKVIVRPYETQDDWPNSGSPVEEPLKPASGGRPLDMMLEEEKNPAMDASPSEVGQVV